MSNLHLITGYAGQEHITSADQGSFNAAMLGNGEFVLERGNKFEAQIITNNQVRVLDGDIMMQGRHIRMTDGTYTDLYFDNGTQGYKRKDLIVVRYEKDATTDIEQANLVVIKGTPSETTAAIPEHTTGDILTEHDLVHEMPLYVVEFDGINIQPISEPLFDTLPTWETLKKEALDDINVQWKAKVKEADEKIAELDSKILNTLEEIEASTEENLVAGALAVKELSTEVSDCFQSVSDGKSLIASAITGKGISTASNATFSTMATNIKNISTGYKVYSVQLYPTSAANSSYSSSVLRITFTKTFSSPIRGIFPYSIKYSDGEKWYTLKPYNTSSYKPNYEFYSSQGSSTLTFYMHFHDMCYEGYVTQIDGSTIWATTCISNSNLKSRINNGENRMYLNCYVVY